MAGYAYVATLVLQEQFGPIKASEPASASIPPDESAEIPELESAA
jgi:hypothetical protein